MLTRRQLGGVAAGAAIVASGRATAQTPLTPDEAFWQDGRYLPKYLDLVARAEAGDAGAAAMLPHHAAFLGDERTALARPVGSSGASPPDLSGAQAHDALDVIVEAAREHRIVILNEAHNVSRHRQFAAQAARALRPLGFDWLAAETFIPKQPVPAPNISLYRAGTPFHHHYGVYSRDPVFAEMIREAARLGYGFTDYEIRQDQSLLSRDADGEALIAEREEAQADNLIEAVLRPYPESRVFLYCGYSHATETPGRGGEWFAARLKRKTGIDPLTIDQAYSWPAADPAQDYPWVAGVLESLNPTRPVVVYQQNGAVLIPDPFAGQVDLAVFHPRLPLVNGRPGWLAADPDRIAVGVDVPIVEGPTLLQAVPAAEGPGAVPADQLLLAPGQRRATLFLRPAHYLVRFETTDGVRTYGRIVIEPA